ncbi:hypothetical protein N7490_000101 [Penicillium lividum]|nr:hypothetical protein N7490_000101 [Penicillium lividum]
MPGGTHHCFTCKESTSKNCVRKGHLSRCATHDRFFHKWADCRGCTSEAKQQERKEKEKKRKEIQGNGSKGSKVDLKKS